MTVYKKYKIKIILLLFSAFSSISCEKDIKDKIPKDQPRLEFYHKKAKKIFKTNSTKNNGKIWISQPLYHSIAGRKIKNNSTFHVGLNLLDNDIIEIFVTQSYDNQTKSKDSELFNNLNLYKIGGEVRTEFTTLYRGVLMELSKVIDFDFIIKEYTKEKIVLLPFKQLAIKEFVFRPYEYKKFESFARVCEVLYSTITDPNRRTLITLKDRDKIIHSNGKFLSSDLSQRVVIQYLHPTTHTLAFKVGDISPDNPFISTTKKMNDLGIDRLKPVSVSKGKVVLSSYGIDSVEDGRYTIIIDR